MLLICGSVCVVLLFYKLFEKNGTNKVIKLYVDDNGVIPNDYKMDDAITFCDLGLVTPFQLMIKVNILKIFVLLTTKSVNFTVNKNVPIVWKDKHATPYLNLDIDTKWNCKIFELYYNLFSINDPKEFLFTIKMKYPEEYLSRENMENIYKCIDDNEIKTTYITSIKIE